MNKKMDATRTAKDAYFIALSCIVLSACTVVSIADDRSKRERRNENFNAAHFVSVIWHSKIIPAFAADTPDISTVLQAARADLATAGSKYGRQGAIGGPWTFAVRGQGVVKAKNTQSRMGTLTVELALPDGPVQVDILTGPVALGSAIRDSQSNISFNDFDNQIAYAQVSRELNLRALTSVKSPLSSVKVGDTLEFAGAFSLAAYDAPVQIMPISIRPRP